MKIEEIKTIVKLMSENDLTEFKIESEDMTLCLRRGSVAAPILAPAVAAPAPAVIPAAAPVAAAPAPVAPAAAPAPAAKPDKAKMIESPIVGTFYRASAPGAEPMVKVGDRVDSEAVWSKKFWWKTVSRWNSVSRSSSWNDHKTPVFPV